MEFWMPADGALPTAVAELERDHACLELAEFRTRSISAAHHYLDAVVAGLVLGPMTDGVQLSPMTEKLMRTVARAVDSVAGRLVKSTLKKAPREELAGLLEFLSACVESSPTRAVVNVALDEETSAAVRAALDADAAGENDAGRPHLARALRGVTSCSMRELYDRPFAILSLGGLTGRAVRAGSGTIESGAHSAIDRAIKSASPEDLHKMSGYVRRRSTAPA